MTKNAGKCKNLGISQDFMDISNFTETCQLPSTRIMSCNLELSWASMINNSS